MKAFLSTEMEKVVREEKFLKEEPERLESALRRCKKLTGTLVTLKRLYFSQFNFLKRYNLVLILDWQVCKNNDCHVRPLRAMEDSLPALQKHHQSHRLPRNTARWVLVLLIAS